MPPANQQEIKEFTGYNHQQPVISIFPNPSTSGSIMSISSNDPEGFSMYIHNVLGQLVYEKKDIGRSGFEFDLSSQPKGVYFINIIQKEKIYTKKLILK
jgi:hypothetical protein